MKTSTRSRRAISPLLATIILIAITIVGGLVVYSIFTSSAGTAGSQTSVQVVSDQLVVPTGGGQATWAITVKNSGNKPITALTVQLGGGASTTLAGCSSSTGLFLVTPSSCSGGASTTINLAPGQSISGSTTASGVTIGQTYTVTVTATFVDGSTSTNVFSVQATSS